MRGLKVQVDFATGLRAGGVINPRDKNLRCPPAWQNIEAGVEVRLVLDGDVSKYEGKPGVQVLSGEAEIDAAVESITQERFAIADMALCMESVRQKKINLEDLTQDLTGEALAKVLYERGALGIKRRGKEHAPKAKAMAKAHGVKGVE